MLGRYGTFTTNIANRLPRTTKKIKQADDIALTITNQLHTYGPIDYSYSYCCRNYKNRVTTTSTYIQIPYYYDQL